MNKIKLLISSISILILFSVACFTLSADPIDRVVANVNGTPIKLSELKEYSKPYIENGKIDSSRESMMNVLNTMIDEELIIQICSENGIEIDKDRVNNIINKLKTKLKTDTLDIILKYYDVPTEFILRRRIKVDAGLLMMISKLKKGKELTFDVKIPTNQEITDYYYENSELFSVVEEREIKHIVISYDNEKEQKKANKLIKKILNKLSEDISQFEYLAKRYSDDITTKDDGGNLGYYRYYEFKRLFPYYYDDAFSIDKNEISEIIELDNAYAILYITDIRISDKKPLGEVSDKIFNDLLSKNFYNAFGPYFDKFKNDSYIEYKY